LGIFTTFSGLCAIAWSIQALILFRFLQRLGGGGVWVLAMAVIKDVYSEEESVHMISTVTFVIALSPAAAPIFGGYIGTFLWVACILLHR